MIVGLGNDLVCIERIRRLHEQYGLRLAQRILNEKEKQGYERVKEKEFYLAKRFAVKEATAKALGTGFRDGIGKRDIYIEHDHLGRPMVFLQGKAETRFNALGATKIWASITDDGKYALATVVLEK
ncbi:MAG: holo-ACP synthase [Gammaproteobacteria bacterium]